MGTKWFPPSPLLPISRSFRRTVFSVKNMMRFAMKTKKIIGCSLKLPVFRWKQVELSEETKSWIEIVFFFVTFQNKGPFCQKMSAWFFHRSNFRFDRHRPIDPSPKKKEIGWDRMELVEGFFGVWDEGVFERCTLPKKLTCQQNIHHWKMSFPIENGDIPMSC